MEGLQAKVQGKVLAPAPATYHRDFGNRRAVAPRAVVLPASVEDVQEAVGFARQHGLRIVARGHGCSSDGQSLSEHLVIDLRSLTDVRFDGGSSYFAEAGAGWGAVQQTLFEQGAVCQVLVDNAHATVGGTLSVAGFGSTSLRLGAQVEQVESLDVVTGTGEFMRVRPGGPNGELFDFSLCGLGQTAIITGAVMRCRPRPIGTHLSRHILAGQLPIEEAINVLLSAEGAQHGFLSKVLAQDIWQVVTGRDVFTEAERAPLATGEIFLERYHEQRFALSQSYLPFFGKAQVRAGLLKEASEACNIWSDFLVPLPAAGALASAVASLHDDPRFTQGPLGTVLLRDAAATWLPLCPIPRADRVLSWGVYCVLPPSHTAEYEKRFHAAAQACLELGGKVYLYGCHPHTPDFYRQQFGAPTLRAWHDVKRRYDPDGVIGQGLFG